MDEPLSADYRCRTLLQFNPAPHSILALFLFDRHRHEVLSDFRRPHGSWPDKVSKDPIFWEMKIATRRVERIKEFEKKI